MKSANSKCDTEDQSEYTDIQVKVQCSTSKLFYEACKANGEDPAGALTDAINIYIMPTEQPQPIKIQDISPDL